MKLNLLRVFAYIPDLIKKLIYKFLDIVNIKLLKIETKIKYIKSKFNSE